MFTKVTLRSYLPLVIIFLLLNMALVIVRLIVGSAPEFAIILIGNLILFAATLISFNLYRKALLNNNVQVFLRQIYAGMFFKMIICIAAALLYIWIARDSVRKSVVFGCFGLYFIYTFVEVRIIMRLNKPQKNA